MILLHTNTRKINIHSVKSLTSRGATSLIKALEEIETKYDTRGFNIMNYHGYNDFNIKALETSLLPDLLHIYGFF